MINSNCAKQIAVESSRSNTQFFFLLILDDLVLMMGFSQMIQREI